MSESTDDPSLLPLPEVGWGELDSPAVEQLAFGRLRPPDWRDHGLEVVQCTRCINFQWLLAPPRSPASNNDNPSVRSRQMSDRSSTRLRATGSSGTSTQGSNTSQYRRVGTRGLCLACVSLGGVCLTAGNACEHG